MYFWVLAIYIPKLIFFTHKAGTGHLSLMIKLESDVKRLKCDLQLSRNRENELRDQIVCYMSRFFYFIFFLLFSFMSIY